MFKSKSEQDAQPCPVSTEVATHSSTAQIKDSTKLEAPFLRMRNLHGLCMVTLEVQVDRAVLVNV